MEEIDKHGNGSSQMSNSASSYAHPLIKMYTLPGCSFCLKAKKLLRDNGVEWEEVDVSVLSNREEMIRLSSGKVSVPQIFLRGTHIGGYTKLDLMYKSGFLAELKSRNSKQERKAKRRLYKDSGRLSSQEIMLNDSCMRVDRFLSIIQNEFCPDYVKNRTYHLRTYRRCFIGQDLVSWTMDRLGVSQRQDALAACEILYDMRFMQHVVNEHKMKDEHLFYRWAWDEVTTVLNRMQCANTGEDLEHPQHHYTSLLSNGFAACVDKDYTVPSSTTSAPKQIRGSLMSPVAASSSLTTAIHHHKQRDPLQLVLKLHKQLGELKERYTVEELGGVDYVSLAEDVEFVRFRLMTSALSQIDLRELTAYNLRLAFFINIYNLLVGHAFAQVGIPSSTIPRLIFFSRVSYDIGGVVLSLSQIENGILRGNKRPPFGLTRTLSAELQSARTSTLSADATDASGSNNQSTISRLLSQVGDEIGFAINSLKRSASSDDSGRPAFCPMVNENDNDIPYHSSVNIGHSNETSCQSDCIRKQTMSEDFGAEDSHPASLSSFIFWEPDCRVHFALNCGAESCPPVKVYTEENIQDELELSAVAFCSDPNNVTVEQSSNTVKLSKIFSWYECDFTEDAPRVGICDVIYAWLRGSEHSKLNCMLEGCGRHNIKVKYNPYSWKTDSCNARAYEW